MSAALIGKIHRVRLKGLTVVKTGKISGGINAMFASYPDVWAALKPALDEEGLSVGFAGAQLGAFGGEGAESVLMPMEISDGESSTGHLFAMMIPEKILNSRGSSVTNNAQRVANAQSYLKRTALIHFFGMSAGNEDEVERMMPAGDQTNIPGVIIPGPDLAWQDLTGGMWENVMSPTGEGKLVDQAGKGGAAMNEMWQLHLEHPGMVAWAADYIEAKLYASGLDWADLMEFGAALPSNMQACNGAQMRDAAKILKHAVAERGQK